MKNIKSLVGLVRCLAALVVFGIIVLVGGTAWGLPASPDDFSWWKQTGSQTIDNEVEKTLVSGVWITNKVGVKVRILNRINVGGPNQWFTEEFNQTHLQDWGKWDKVYHYRLHLEYSGATRSPQQVNIVEVLYGNNTTSVSTYPGVVDWSIDPNALGKVLWQCAGDTPTYIDDTEVETSQEFEFTNSHAGPMVVTAWARPFNVSTPFSFTTLTVPPKSTFRTWIRYSGPRAMFHTFTRTISDTPPNNQE